MKTKDDKHNLLEKYYSKLRFVPLYIMLILFTLLILDVIMIVFTHEICGRGLYEMNCRGMETISAMILSFGSLIYSISIGVINRTEKIFKNNIQWTIGNILLSILMIVLSFCFFIYYIFSLMVIVN